MGRPICFFPQIGSSSSAAMLSGSATPEHSTTNLARGSGEATNDWHKGICLRKSQKKNYGNYSLQIAQVMDVLENRPE